MKKTLIISILFTLYASIIFGQSRFNILGGANLASLNLEKVFGSQGPTSEARVGFVGGLGFDGALGGSKHVHLCLNILYAQKGASIIEGGVRGDWITEFTETELLFKLGNHVFVEAGIGGAKLLSAQVVSPGGHTDPIHAIMKGFSGSFLLGGGFRLGPIILEVRYGGDFTPAFNQPLPQQVSQHSLMFLSGLSFGFN